MYAYMCVINALSMYARVCICVHSDVYTYVCARVCASWQANLFVCFPVFFLTLPRAVLHLAAPVGWLMDCAGLQLLSICVYTVVVQTLTLTPCHTCHRPSASSRYYHSEIPRSHHNKTLRPSAPHVRPPSSSRAGRPASGSNADSEVNKRECSNKSNH